MQDTIIKLALAMSLLAAFALGRAAVAGAVSGGGTGSVATGTADSSTAASAATVLARGGAPAGLGPARSDETVLTGDTATKVQAGAAARIPGGTIERVETDADGHAAYEAHMTNADGERVTVCVSEEFEVVSVETGR